MNLFFGAELPFSSAPSYRNRPNPLIRLAPSPKSSIQYSREFSLFVAFLPKYLFAFLLIHSLNVSIEELCVGERFEDLDHGLPQRRVQLMRRSERELLTGSSFHPACNRLVESDLHCSVYVGGLIVRRAF